TDADDAVRLCLVCDTVASLDARHPAILVRYQPIKPAPRAGAAYIAQYEVIVQFCATAKRASSRGWRDTVAAAGCRRDSPGLPATRRDRRQLELAVAQYKPAESAAVILDRPFPGMARLARRPGVANDPHPHQRHVLRCGRPRRRPAVGSDHNGPGHHLGSPGRAARQPAGLREHQAPRADSRPGAKLVATAATPAADMAAAMGAARGSAGNPGMPGEHGLGRDLGVQAR